MSKVGRPAVPRDKKKVRVNVMLAPASLKTLAKIDPNRSAAIEKLIKEWGKSNK